MAQNAIPDDLTGAKAAVGAPVALGALKSRLAANALEIQAIREALESEKTLAQVRRVQATLTGEPKERPLLTHTHHCRHCDSYLSHKARCDLDIDITKLCPCAEGKAKRKLMFALMNQKPCKYGCTGCNHPGVKD